MFEKQCIKVVNVDPFSSPQLFPNIMLIYAFWDISFAICACVFSPWIICTHVSMYHPWFTPSPAITKLYCCFTLLLALLVTTTLTMTPQQGHYNLKNSQHTHILHSQCNALHSPVHILLHWTVSLSAGVNQIQFCWVSSSTLWTAPSHPYYILTTPTH